MSRPGHLRIAIRGRRDAAGMGVVEPENFQAALTGLALNAQMRTRVEQVTVVAVCGGHVGRGVNLVNYRPLTFM